jgi:hypothetical protein
MAGNTIKSSKTPIINLLVRVLLNAAPSRPGSSSRLSAACWAFWDNFYYSLILASSAAEFDFTRYL